MGSIKPLGWDRACGGLAGAPLRTAVAPRRGRPPLDPNRASALSPPVRDLVDHAVTVVVETVATLGVVIGGRVARGNTHRAQRRAGGAARGQTHGATCTVDLCRIIDGSVAVVVHAVVAGVGGRGEHLAGARRRPSRRRRPSSRPTPVPMPRCGSPARTSCRAPNCSRPSFPSPCACCCRCWCCCAAGWTA